MNPKEKELFIVAMAERDPVMRARIVAHVVHYHQKRDWTQEPYIVHPLRVMELVSRHPNSDDNMVAAALLHDTVEDCDWFTPIVLTKLFAGKVSDIVLELTNTSGEFKKKGVLRAERKRLDRERLSCVSSEARLLKLFDRIDNVSDMTRNGGSTKFKQLYAEESILLGQRIGGVDKRVQRWLFEEAEKLKVSCDE